MHPAIQTLLRGKAHSAPEFSGRQPPLFFNDASTGARRRLSNRNAARHTSAYGGSDAIDLVMDCVDLYAQTASNADFHFESTTGRVLRPHPRKDSDPDEGTAPQDLVRLFEHPNPMMDYTELLELSIIDILLAGEFFWLKHEMNGLGKPRALYRISPSLIDVVPGSVCPKSYIYTPPGGGDALHFQPQQILHVKRPNPHDPWRGLGVIAGGPRMFDISLALVDTMAAYYEQGTSLTGVLESERTITDSSWKKITRQFRALYSGSSNAGKVAMLERGLKFKPISGTAEQAAFKEISNWSEERIAKAFRVPLPLLGQVGGTDRQAVREAQRIFDNKTMRPFLNRLQSTISHGLTQPWNLTYHIDHEYVMPIEDLFDLAQIYGALPGVKVREIREFVDLKPLGDERDEIVLNLPGMDREDGGHPDRPLGPEPGRPPRPENTKPFPEVGGELPASAAARREQAQKAIERAKATLEEVRNGAT